MEGGRGMNGFDLSTYQEGINYDKLAEKGDFVILKVGEGDFKDKLFDTHYWECKQRGMKIGAYFFSRATTNHEAYKEALNCAKFLGDKKLDLPVYYDVETKRHMQLSKDKLTDLVQVFYRTVATETDYEVGIYTNPNFMENYLNKKVLVNDKACHIWLAHWTHDPNKKSKYDYGQECWQWGLTQIDGKDVDADIWLKEDEDFEPSDVYCVIAHKKVSTMADAEGEVTKLEAQGYDVFIGSQDDIENDY